jgi:hypothetical protein
MEYFFIAGNVASLMALAGFLLQLSHLVPDNKVTWWTLVASVAVTLLFWVYFYFAPRNRVKKTIKDRLTFAGLYMSSSNDPIEVYEGEFTLAKFGILTVPIPPFESKPTVTIFSVEQLEGNPPSVSKVTLDSFEVSATTSNQWRAWRFRARGRQLLPRKEPT